MSRSYLPSNIFYEKIWEKKFMKNCEILEIALRQSAEDMGCRAEDFLSVQNVIFPLRLGINARKYLKEPITCNLISYGNNIVAATTKEVSDIVSEYIGKYEFYHCFETPNMHWLNDRLTEKGHKICFMAEYYLPDVNRLPRMSCAYEMRIFEQKDFEGLYLPEWSNALCENRRHLDVLGIGAFDGKRLVGLAACSADCEDMRQIGIDVLPEYRRQGIASALTSALAREIMNRGKVPFYCSAWSNIRSVRNAVKSGFIPAWVEMTAKPVSIVDEMNR
jgi:ribosomal protein S18 acetylase RimI-like enzyme